MSPPTEKNDESKKKEGSSSIFDRLMGGLFDNPVDLQGEIHQKLNEHEERQRRQQEAFVHPAAAAGFGNLDEIFSQALQGGGGMMPPSFGDTLSSGDNGSKTSSWSRSFSSSYRMRQDGNGVQIDVDVPGKTIQDLQVQVVEDLSRCSVEWKTESASQKNKDEVGSASRHLQEFHTQPQRMNLGQAVDCGKLSATLSKGVLQMKAPLKKASEGQAAGSGRSVPVTERDDF